MADTDNKPQSPLSMARDVAAIAGVFLFFIGFVYRHFFQQKLGLQHPGEVPFYEIVVYSWTVFQLHPWPFFGLITFLFIIGALRRKLRSDAGGAIYGPLEFVIVSALVVLTFYIGYITARQSAVMSVILTRTGHQTTPNKFFFTDGVLHRFPELAEDNRNEQLLLVSQDEHFFYILDQPGMTEPWPPSARLLAIRRSDIISYVTVVP